MAVQRMLQVINKLILIFVIHDVVSNNHIASGNVFIEPLWNVSANLSNPCTVNNASNNMVYFTGSPDRTCPLLLNASEGYSIQLQIHGRMNDYLNESLIFVERSDVDLEICTSKYVVFNDNVPCSAALTARYVILMVFGGVKVSVGSMTTDVMTHCSNTENNMNIRDNEGFGCKDVQGYSDMVMCTTYQPYNGFCTIRFETNCDVVLGPREAIYECDTYDTSQNRRVLIPYPNVILNDYSSDVTVLFLKENKITKLNRGCFQGLGKLETLRLEENMLSTASLQNGIFQDLLGLELLQLSQNQISELHAGYFQGLQKLRVLHLNKNNLSFVQTGTFSNLHNLVTLGLDSNQIIKLNIGCFYGLGKLRNLFLSDNRLSALSGEIFTDIPSLWILDISYNSLTLLTNASLSSLPWYVQLVANQHEVCECFVPDRDIYCFAFEQRSPYLTCKRLLSDKTLVVFMWFIGFNAFCGNLFVLIWRFKVTAKNKVNSILLINLALSDFLMGIYMCIMGAADIYFGNYFPMQAESWRIGVTCRTAGALSIISSEASVFFVMLISNDRFICIRFPYSSRKLSRISVTVVAILTWMVSFVLGVVPSSLAGRSVDFYDNSHVCIGLPLTLPFYTEWSFKSDSYITVEISGHYYSSSLFLVLNAVCYLVVLACYIEIVRAAVKTSKQAGRSPDMAEQLKLTRKVTAIVATDFCCWAPVIIIGILVQTRMIQLSASVFAWCVTFVLPINSGINPYLYTVDEIITKYRKKKPVKKHLRRDDTRRPKERNVPTTASLTSITQETKICPD